MRDPPQLDTIPPGKGHLKSAPGALQITHRNMKTVADDAEEITLIFTSI